MGRVLTVVALSILALLTTRPARAAEASPEGFWRYSWQPHAGGDWRPGGLVEVRRDGTGFQVTYVAGTYAGSGLTLPQRVYDVAIDVKEWTMRETYAIPAGPRSATTRPTELSGVHRLAADGPDRYTGSLTLDGKPDSNSRLERLPDRAAYVAELKAVLARTRAEKVAAAAAVDVTAANRQMFEQMLRNEETAAAARGQGQPNTRTALVVAAAKADHMRAQARLLRATADESAVTEMLTKAEAAR
ncbi:MAG TPA: hypothetical protein VF796_02070 [Humisphaera sp.]